MSKSEFIKAPLHIHSSDSDKPQGKGVFVKMDDTVSEFIKTGNARICYSTKDWVYIIMPENMSDIVNTTQLNKFYFPKQAYISTDITRDVMNVDDIHQGANINSDIIPYTGKDVIIGIIDTGIQPNHITFKDNNGKNRVKKYILTESSYESESGEFISNIYTTDDEISTAPTDIHNEGHGTHTAAIASGSYMGNDFYGIAPDAELIFVSMGELLYDDEIIYGISSALDYADDIQKPIVLNLSLGSALGPQDGTGIVTELLEEVSPEGKIVCFAAGNNGTTPLSLQQNFRTDPNPLSSCFAKTDYGTPADKIYMQAWSSDDTEFEISLHVLDIKNRTIVQSTPYIKYSGYGEKITEGIIICASGNTDESLFPELSDYFEGTILLAAGIQNNNSRYVTELLGVFDNISVESDYTLGFSIKSDSGAEVIAISDCSNCYFKSFGITDFTTGNSNNSISDYCTSPNVISVGSWNARENWTDITGNNHTLNKDYYGNVNYISNYSSYRKSQDGSLSILPHVVAPGTEIISALNSEINNNQNICHSDIVNDTEYLWGNKTGTSMACPATSGVIALWLEAKPDLTRDDIINIIEATSVRDEYINEMPDKVRAGKIDAYAGLKYIFTNLAENTQINDNPHRAIVRYISPRNIEVVLSLASELASIELFTADGKIINCKQFSGNITTFDLPAEQGIYILKITTHTSTITYKLMLK